jgi:tetratricopeptide (TPR) repeat protein
MPETGDDQQQIQKPAAAALQAKLNQGIALHRQGKLADAERCYGEILQRQPKHFDALHLLGVIARQTRRTERGVELIKRAIGLKPNIAQAHNNLGNALRDLKRPAEALASYDRAIALEPDLAVAHSNRGAVLMDLKCLTEALASYDKAIALKPDDAEINWKQSLCLLVMGHFEQGLRQYEWRKKRDVPIGARSYPQPVWLGEQNIAGKTLFIYWEQGLGDTIQFCRYAKHVEGRGAKVIVSVQQPLCRLLKQISPTIRVLRPNEEPTDFDYHCPLLSLPLALGTTLETIPRERQYLKSDEELRSIWSARLPPKTKPRIGVVWSGGTAHTNLFYRSMELQQFLPIFGPDAEWICLQKEISEKDFAILRQFGRVAFFGGDLRDFSDTAALLDLMDLVITIDTSVAHLAGAMGKPVWILLDYNSDWRWLLDRDDSPWYPSVKLFRQQQIGNWATATDQVKNELRSAIL